MLIPYLHRPGGRGKRERERERGGGGGGVREKGRKGDNGEKRD